jgi:hypothetical protein
MRAIRLVCMLGEWVKDIGTSEGTAALNVSVPYDRPPDKP